MNTRDRWTMAVWLLLLTVGLSVMTFVPPWASVRQLGGLGLGLLWMFLTAQALSVSHIVSSLSSPRLTVVSPHDRRDVTVTGGTRQKYRGLFYLFSVYFFMAFAVTFTTGHIGVFHPLGKHEVSPYWVFSVGIMAVALARIASVYFTTGFARHLELLMIFLGGILTYLLVTNYRMFLAYPFGSADKTFITYAFAAVCVALAIIEIVIHVLDKSPAANRVPYSLLSERMQEHATVDQVFVAQRVQDFTDRKLAEIVMAEGLTELLWVTQTPPPHLERLIFPVRLWLTKVRIKEVLVSKGLIRRRLMRDGDGIWYVEPADFKRLRDALENKGWLNRKQQIRVDKCSIRQLKDLLRQANITPKISADATMDIIGSSAMHKLEIKNALAHGCTSYVSQIRREKTLKRYYALIGPCPWLVQIAKILQDNECSIKLVPRKDAIDHIREVSRILITSWHSVPKLEYYQPKYIYEPTRVRYMVINRKHAIVHLPMPFTRRIGEQSNCVHFISSSAIAAIFRNKFESLWDSFGRPTSARQR